MVCSVLSVAGCVLYRYFVRLSLLGMCFYDQKVDSDVSVEKFLHKGHGVLR
jgi:hypothetical protein